MLKALTFNFLLPDFYPPRAALESVTGILPRPMKTKRAVVFLRQLAKGIPCAATSEEAADIDGHSGRHLWPMCAVWERLSEYERDSLGEWKSA